MALRATGRFFLCKPKYNQAVNIQLWKAVNKVSENQNTLKQCLFDGKWKLSTLADIVSTTQLWNSTVTEYSSSLIGNHTKCTLPKLLCRDNALFRVGIVPSACEGTAVNDAKNNDHVNSNRPFQYYKSWYLRWNVTWKKLSNKWFSLKNAWKNKSRSSVQSLLLTSSIGLAATIASDVEPKRTDTGEKVSYGPHSSALLNAAARHGAGSAPPHETGIGLIPGRILKWVGWSLAQLVGIGLIWLMVHHPSSTGIVALIGLLLFATNPSEASFLQWIKTQAPILARHKEAKIDKLRVRIAPYLFNLQDWTLWNFGVCTVIHVRDFADYVYIYVGILGRWILLGWWKDPEFVFE